MVLLAILAWMPGAGFCALESTLVFFIVLIFCFRKTFTEWLTIDVRPLTVCRPSEDIPFLDDYEEIDGDRSLLLYTGLV